LDRLRAVFDELLSVLFRSVTEPIHNRLEALMASVEELKGQMVGAQESLQAAIGRIEEDVQALRDRAESGIDPADLDPISQGLSELKNNLDALDPDPSNPPQA
jgi:predicted  nucleic acid-binding Zn-ribbon protein